MTTAETTIPILPCVAINETLAFYEALGFDVTYRQASPNVYAVVRRGGVELHFFVLKGLDPDASYSTCLVVVPEVESLHQAFAEGLKRAYGKLPHSGRPRLARLRKGQPRFNVVDPAGNWIRFVKREAPAAVSEEGSRSRLAKALDAAAHLRDFKGDLEAAAKVLDVALARQEPSSEEDRVRALAARVELAVDLGDKERASAALTELRQRPLSDEARARLQEDLRAADEAERALR
ncbi:glyoxalase superfamily protein [Archangium lansingense]|uniref:bleomycin resistance protein n=1 Tax=Archangium lansingense TaxID=2995310 RepID=UPI003B7E7F69